MERKQQIYAALKPKVKSFGFTKKELMSVASIVDDNLALSEEATDEEVTNAIDEQIDAVVPVLKLGQSYASRIIDANKNPKPKNDEGDDGDKPSEPKGDDGNGDNDKFALLMKEFESMRQELAAFKSGRTTETRKSMLAAKVGKYGEYGKAKLRDFDRMSFKDDEDYDEFLNGVDAELKAIDKERTAKGLDALGNIPPGGGNAKDGDHKTMELDDAAIDKLIEGIN